MKHSAKYGFILLATFLMTLVVSVLSASAAELQRISAEELKKLIESKANILIVDVQPKGAYEIGHIKGAKNFPWAMDLKSHGNLPKNKTLIVYCDCAHEEDSIDVSRQLQEKWGYTDIKLLEGGWSQWVKLGYPTEKGKKK